MKDHKNIILILIFDFLSHLLTILYFYIRNNLFLASYVLKF